MCYKRFCQEGHLLLFLAVWYLYKEDVMENIVSPVLEAKPMAVEFDTIKVPKNIEYDDKKILEAFKEISPYYWCITTDLPSSVKLIANIDYE